MTYRTAAIIIATGCAAVTPAKADPISFFSPGDLVISTVTDQGGGLDTAAPIVLQQFALGAGGGPTV